jgi:hypothetical protein
MRKLKYLSELKPGMIIKYIGDDSRSGSYCLYRSIEDISIDNLVTFNININLYPTKIISISHHVYPNIISQTIIDGRIWYESWQCMYVDNYVVLNDEA